MEKQQSDHSELAHTHNVPPTCVSDQAVLDCAWAVKCSRRDLSMAALQLLLRPNCATEGGLERCIMSTDDGAQSFCLTVYISPGHD